MTTAAVPAGTCRVQRLTLSGGERTWTVLGADHRAVGSAEEYLEYLRAQRNSPNTVKSYARALALCWQYLGAFSLHWDTVTLEDFGTFLTWLRTGDGPEVVSIEARPARFAESTIAVRLRAVLSLRGPPAQRGGRRSKPASDSPTAGEVPTCPCWSTSLSEKGAGRP